MRATNKISKFFSCLSLFLLLILTSCEGFFTNNDVDEKIRAAIDYANAPYSTFVVSADSNAGTIIPSGQVNYKPTDLQNIEFTCKPGYEFIKWSFSYKMISQGEDTPTLTATDDNWWKDYITIKKQTQSEPNTKGEIVYTLQIQFIKAVDNLLIEPVCSVKPKLDRYPENKARGQSRDEELSFTFNTTIDKNTLFFNQTELAAIDGVSEVLKNGLGEIYGYVKDGKTYFKNIEIVMGDTSRNINESYKDITLKEDKKSLVIFANGRSPVQFSTTTAEIKILFKDGIKSTDGASMYETTIGLTLNKDTNEKSWIAVVTDKNAAVINYNEYNKGEEQRATFTETADIQFLGWHKISSTAFPDSKDNVTIKVNEDDPKKITFWGNEVISRDEEVRIVALYEPRPTYVWNYAANTTYPKDTDIIITFDHEINADSFKDHYSLSIDGYGIKSNFNEPQIVYDAATDKTTITIKPNKQNRLKLSSNKTITLTIPSALFYTVTEPDGKTYDIVLGKNKEVSYAVTPFTSSKASVTISNSNSSFGVIKDKDGNNVTNGSVEYSVDQSFILTFVPNTNSEYAFAGWNISDPAGNLSYTDSSKQTITVNIIDSVQSDTQTVISTKYEPKLSVVAFRANTDTNYSNTNIYPKDSYFTIHLNKQYDSKINLRDYVTILFGNGNSTTDEDVTANFYSITKGENGKAICIKASTYNRLPVSSSSNKITIKIKGSLYYTLPAISDSQEPITIPMQQDYTQTVTLDETTRGKVNINVTNPYDFNTVGQIKDAQNEDFTLGTQPHSIDETFILNFVTKPGYEFIKWELSNSSLVSLSDPYNARTDVSLNNQSSDSIVDITPVVEPKLKVTSVTVHQTIINEQYPLNQNDTFPKDSNITLNFNKKLASSIAYNHIIKNYISILCDNVEVKEKYNISLVSDSEISIKPKERLAITENKDLTIIVDKNLYYEYENSTDHDADRNITLDTDFIQTVTFTPETIKKAYVKILNCDNASLLHADGSAFSNTEIGALNVYNLDKELNIICKPDVGFEFVGWDFKNAGTTYDTVPDNPVQNLMVSNPDDANLGITIVDSKGSANWYAQIQPVVEESLKTPVITINDNSYNSSTVYPKNSIIKITFNKPLGKLADVGKYIHLKYLGDDVKDINFTLTHDENTPEFTFTPKSNALLSVNGSSNLIVSIDKEIYYYISETPGGRSVNKYLTLDSDYTQSILIDYKTRQSVKLIGTLAVEGSGTLTQSFHRDDDIYYMGDKIAFEFEPTQDYSFVEWSRVNGQGLSAAIDENRVILTVTGTGSAAGCVVSPSVQELTKIKSITFENDGLVYSGAQPCDSKIIVEFNRKVTFNGGDLNVTNIIQFNNGLKNYYLYSVDNTGTTTKVILTPRYTLLDWVRGHQGADIIMSITKNKVMNVSDTNKTLDGFYENSGVVSFDENTLRYTFKLSNCLRTTVPVIGTAKMTFNSYSDFEHMDIDMPVPTTKPEDYEQLTEENYDYLAPKVISTDGIFKYKLTNIDIHGNWTNEIASSFYEIETIPVASYSSTYTNVHAALSAPSSSVRKTITKDYKMGQTYNETISFGTGTGGLGYAKNQVFMVIFTFYDLNMNSAKYVYYFTYGVIPTPS